MKNMSMMSRPPFRDEVVRTVEIKGYEYVSIGTLAKMYDMSYNKMVEVISRLQLSHEVRVLELGPRVTRVNLAEFRCALMDCVTVSTQLAKGV